MGEKVAWERLNAKDSKEGMSLLLPTRLGLCSQPAESLLIAVLPVIVVGVIPTS